MPKEILSESDAAFALEARRAIDEFGDDDSYTVDMLAGRIGAPDKAAWTELVSGVFRERRF